MPLKSCKICGHRLAGPHPIAKPPALDRLCHPCWKWAGKVLFGWRAA